MWARLPRGAKPEWATPAFIAGLASVGLFWTAAAPRFLLAPILGIAAIVFGLAAWRVAGDGSQARVALAAIVAGLLGLVLSATTIAERGL